MQTVYKQLRAFLLFWVVAFLLPSLFVQHATASDSAVPVDVSPLEQTATLTLSFSGMTPHVGQLLEIRVVSKSTQMEVGRTQVDPITMADFNVVMVDVLETGGSYWIDFYADFSGNGLYDTPPADHAWRLDLDAVQGDTTLNFAHNTNFVDIDWVYLFTLDLAGMTPHVGQGFGLRVVNVRNGLEVGRTSLAAIPSATFSVSIPGIRLGENYQVDFYADFNGDGFYDTPPTDHAWRMSFEDTGGDTTLLFTHNTNFTDIEWNYLLTFNLSGMNPHLGQQFEVRLVDVNNNMEVGRKKLSAIVVPDFTIMLPGLQTGNIYRLDYYADFNGNGLYDAPPTDHAWRSLFTDSNGDETVNFTHNVNFTDVDWVYLFTLNLSGMAPHLNQQFNLRVVDRATRREVGRVRVEAIAFSEFSVSVPGVRKDGNYQVDYYADFNGNGFYDAPPTDHAWREVFTNAGGDFSMDFAHNTNFVDIEWSYLFTLDLTGMTPHLGQLMELRIVNQSDGSEAGRTRLDTIAAANFSVKVSGIEPGEDYNVDFYADFNNNGLYDPPPMDHAWRISFSNTTGDVGMAFAHNTNFTDVSWVYLFTMNLMGMNPHLGQLFELRVVDESDESEVGRVKLDSIVVPDFSVFVPGILIGGNYRADFYADFNNNGTYDPPPTDHAWRELFSDTTGNVELNFTHNTNFTDIEYPTAIEPVENAPVPREFQLSQNYPNPFNPVTVIKFSVPRTADVRVEVFNVLGQRVQTLINESVQPGQYQVVWDGRDEAGNLLGSGLYFYRLQAQGFQKIKRMLLIK